MSQRCVPCGAVFVPATTACPFCGDLLTLPLEERMAEKTPAPPDLPDEEPDQRERTRRPRTTRKPRTRKVA